MKLRIRDAVGCAVSVFAMVLTGALLNSRISVSAQPTSTVSGLPQVVDKYGTEVGPLVVFPYEQQMDYPLSESVFDYVLFNADGNWVLVPVWTKGFAPIGVVLYFATTTCSGQAYLAFGPWYYGNPSSVSRGLSLFYLAVQPVPASPSWSWSGGIVSSSDGSVVLYYPVPDAGELSSRILTLVEQQDLLSRRAG